MTLTLPPELEARLETYVSAHGEDKERFVLSAVQDALDKQSPPLKEWQVRALEGLKQMEEGDAQEQQETLAYLARAIDEDRPGERSIFGTGFNPMPGETK